MKVNEAKRISFLLRHGKKWLVQPGLRSCRAGIVMKGAIPTRFLPQRNASPFAQASAKKLSTPKAFGARRRYKCGVDHREIREIRESRFAFVRVFRVVRGEQALLLRLFAPFRGKSIEMTCHEPFTTRSGPHAAQVNQAESTLIKLFSCSPSFQNRLANLPFGGYVDGQLKCCDLY
jgi:hypothetical protein